VTVQRLTTGDHLNVLSDDLLSLARRIDSPAKTHREIEDRVHEGERIARAVTNLVRGRARG
jgi:hypothetical protein